MIERVPSDLLDSQIVAGHTGYGRELRPSGGDEGEGGIGTPWIVAVLLLVLGAGGLLVWLSSERTKAKLRTAAPALLIAAVIATPLIVWTATSDENNDKERLIAERAKSPTGAPELVVSLGDDELNTLRLTSGKASVEVECFGLEGNMVLRGRQRWPFADEPGFEYPHVHQTASADQLLRAKRCRLRGTNVRLEADVEGASAG